MDSNQQGGQSAGQTGQNTTSSTQTATQPTPVQGVNQGVANPSSYVINLQGIPNTQAPSQDDEAALLTKFAVPDEVKNKYPELTKLIIQSESMTDDERQYWFQILPIMSEDQIKKFKDILDTEKKQLDTLDKEYEDQLKKLNSRHDIEWKDFETKEKRRDIEKKEAQAKSEDSKAQEDLLAQLNSL